MALTSQGFFASFTLRDTGGNASVITYNLTAATIAAAVTDAATIAGLLAAVTEATIEKYSVGENYVEDAFSYPADASNWNKASMKVALSTAGKYANLTIPAPVDGIFTAASGPGYDVVDASDAALLAYVAIFQSGGQATISDGEVVAAAPAIDGRRVSSRVTKTGQR